MPTIGEWRLFMRQKLRDVSGSFAVSDADSILGEVTRANPTQLTLRHLDVPSKRQEERLRELLDSRLTGRPLAYVVGHVEFFGLDFICDERVLIPRPDTEEVVHVALRALPPPSGGYRPLVIDVGTGSGNIAIAMARERADLRVIATDYSPDALAVADSNRKRHGLSDRVELLEGEALSMIAPGVGADVIVGNPPYIADEDPEVQESVRNYEPHVALYSGPAGTEILAELIRDALAILRHGGALVCELGHRQAPAIRSLILDTAGWEEPTFHRNFAGVDRVLEVRRP